MRRLPAKYDPTAMSQPAEETNDPLIADHRNFYKVEKRTKDGSKVDHLLYAGSNLDKAREVFTAAIKHRLQLQAGNVVIVRNEELAAMVALRSGLISQRRTRGP